MSKTLYNYETYKKLLDYDYELAEKSFYHFFKCAWGVIEPKTELLNNWHQELIGEYLTACYTRQIKRLIINIPPRYSKSTLATITFPCWVWVKNPSESFMFASYNYGLAMKHSGDRRILFGSKWFLNRWADRFSITKDTTQFLENSKRGHFVSTSMEGTATGLGANILIIDDPHDVQKAQSDKIREKEVEIFDKKLYNRLNDKTNGVIIVIMQRVHESDLTGHLLAEKEHWEHLKIPAVCEKSYIVNFPISKKSFERQEGNILHPERENTDKIQEQKNKGSFYFSGQYQQNPSPIEGGIIKKNYFRFYNKLPDKFDIVMDSWDLSVKDGQNSDFAVGVVWGVVGSLRYILHITKKKMGFSDSIKEILNLRALYPKIERSVIEDKANGSPIIEILRNKITGIIPYNPQMDKVSRLMSCEPSFEAGQVLLPVKEIATFDIEDYIDSMLKFPNSDHDDDVDATTTGLIYINTLFKDIHFEVL